MKRSGLSLNVLVLYLLLVAALVGAQGPASAREAQIAAIESQKVPVEGGGSYTGVSVTGLTQMLKQKDFLLINVHIPYEGEINGTDLFVPFNEVEANLGKLPADKSAKLVVYCRSGRMSAIAARALVKLGYTNVWNLDGGMFAWKQTGYPLVNSQ